MSRSSFAPALVYAVAVLVPFRAAAATTEEPSPHDIVARADAIRFPQTGYEVDVTVASSAAGREPDLRKYRILSKGNDRTLVITSSPPADRGQILLMKDKDLWLYVPSLSQPVRLPLSQRLTGQVANGDLARSNFSGDYNGTVLRTEEVEGKPHWVLELTATERSLTYHRLLYWVEQKSFRPYKAEFYGISGKLLKTCSYQNFVEAGGSRRPRTVVMADALAAGARSVLEYSSFRIREIPDKFFTKDYLKKLGE